MGCITCGEKDCLNEVYYSEDGTYYVTYVCDDHLYSFVHSHDTGQIFKLKEMRD